MRESQNGVGISGIGLKFSTVGQFSFSRKDNFVPDRQAGKTSPDAVCGARDLSCIVRGLVPVMKYIVALFAHGGKRQYRLRNFVKIASSACMVESEHLFIQIGKQ